MKPRIGKSVHYRSRGSADGVFPPECRAALITKVHAPLLPGDDGYVVDLAVLKSGVWFDEDITYNEDMEPGTWHYPDHDDDLPEDPPDDEHVMAKPKT